MKQDEARALMCKLNDTTVYNDCCLLEVSKGEYEVYSQQFGNINGVELMNVFDKIHELLMAEGYIVTECDIDKSNGSEFTQYYKQGQGNVLISTEPEDKNE